MKTIKDLNRENSESTINNSLYWNKQNGLCYYGQSNTTTSCDFTTTGLTDESKKLIGEVIWHTGTSGTEISEDNISTSKFYELERSSNGKICTSGSNCNDSVERTTNWTGHIALLYPSDYGFATSGGNLTNRVKCIDTVLYKWSDSSISYCKSNNCYIN